MKMLVMCCVGWSDKTDVRCEVFYRTCFRFFEERTPNFSQPDTLNLLTPTRKARPVRATNRQQLYQQLYQQLFAPLFRVVDRPLKVVDQNNSSQNGRFWDELFSSTTFSNSSTTYRFSVFPL